MYNKTRSRQKKLFMMFAIHKQDQVTATQSYNRAVSTLQMKGNIKGLSGVRGGSNEGSHGLL